jgi:hypothetical protein
MTPETPVSRLRERRLGHLAERVRVSLVLPNAGTPSPGALARVSPLPKAGEGA